ncbi:unnamed protein product [Sordaria macrospora k-hell]|uniref:WGS project CABT00000000 data, contig 2.33 n=2 Tax=Sordaria macrospora TaxID=5147 RepID=F7W6A7_SORMK|nr:uncharacterized protein SMAC_06188 [Sordaria macrospora k-hell]KAH7630285.1 hypothetical protein B0T09DRAFT_265168 [Sordaria sp. MPI-SDFR-AT-0083]CCC13045.1 unnamed protein product [Sordaria macrospora k-hell]
MLDHATSSHPVNGQNGHVIGGLDGTNDGGQGRIVNGGGGNGAGAGGSKRPPMPHIDDIKAVTVSIDPATPIESALKLAEEALQQAKAFQSFGRIDMAFKSYIKANIIALDIIPKNRDWPVLERTRPNVYMRHQHLLRQIKCLIQDFDKIKAQIKQDNARTGAQPLLGSPNQQKMPSVGNGHTRSHSNFSSNTTSPNSSVYSSPQQRTNALPVQSGWASPGRSKPAVHPKPQALHGHTLQQFGGPAPPPTNNAAQDLALRFAKLRANTASTPSPTNTTAVQDPRIRTQPIPQPMMPINPPAPRDPPRPQLPSVPPSAALADLPRVPAAIYNPPRGTVSNEAAELPSSAPRAMFSRKGSTASVSGMNRNGRPRTSDENLVSGPPVTSPKTRSKPTIPDGDTISAEELERYMRLGAREVSILVIDIRSRDEYDDGHIMSQATICVENEVLLRPDISASQVAESMVLAPQAEQQHFERRHDFDMIVFYDQQSKRLVSSPRTPEERAVLTFYNALTAYDYAGGSSSQQRLKLLRGGLEAWTDLVGTGALQTSATSATARTQQRPPLAHNLTNRLRRNVTRPIQDLAEVQKWEENVDIVTPVRTTEDFLRRYPSVSTIQESMTSPIHTSPARPASPLPRHIVHEQNLYSSLPSPPTRPAPTVPRRSYSGLAETDTSTTATSKRSSLKSGIEKVRKFRTGLVNPGVFCFANSSLQAMFATPGFSRELYTGVWKDVYKVPLKADEKNENPQLLTKYLAGLFHWLDEGTLRSLEAKHLMAYIHFIHSKNADGRKKPESEIFGGPAQQDAQEFYSFIIDNIHDETNIHRDRKPPKEEKPYTPKNGTVIQNAIDYWRDYSTASASIIDKYFRGLEVFISRCQNAECRQEIRMFQPCDVWILNIAAETGGEGNGYGATDLDRLLASHQATEHFADLKCETCNKPGRTRRAKFARLPDRLAFCLNRFNSSFGQSRSFTSMLSGSGGSNKIHTKVRFPIRDLDLTRYCAEPDPDMATTDDPHYAGRMKYDCYAVTVHVGQGINGGHYYTYVQDEQSKDPTDWFKCNDDVVERVKIGSVSGSGGINGNGSNGGNIPDLTEVMYANGNTSAYMVYYRRQGT